MRTICLYFQIHQPFRFRRYRFFDIGDSHYYYDDYTNKAVMQKIAKKCYLPANEIILDLINKNKNKFKVSYSISGLAIEQFELYAPEVLESFKKLAKTGCVEFLAETYSHSLASLISEQEFIAQIKAHSAKIETLFGQKPTVFRNTELIYNDAIGEIVANMGFKAMLTEGAKHILGWKSPNYLYYNVNNPKLKLLLKNFKLSDDIAFRFSDKGWRDYPLTPEKFTDWLNDIESKEEIINLFMDYETFGEHQWKETGIFDFLKAFPKEVLRKTDFTFSTPSLIANDFEAIAPLNVPHPISWADEERDLTAWLGNELQDEAFNKLFGLAEKINLITDAKIKTDWLRLQTSDHFYYMCTKIFSDGDVHEYFNPFNSPYEAFINYMNILSDFIIRVDQAPKILPDKVNEEISYITDDDNNITTQSPYHEFKLDGRMTVKSLKRLLKDLFKISVRVYKNAKAEKKNKQVIINTKLSKLTSLKKSLASQGVIAVEKNTTVKEFEKEFENKYKITIRLTDANDKKPLKNKQFLMVNYELKTI